MTSACVQRARRGEDRKSKPPAHSTETPQHGGLSFQQDHPRTGTLLCVSGRDRPPCHVPLTGPPPPGLVTGIRCPCGEWNRPGWQSGGLVDRGASPVSGADVHGLDRINKLALSPLPRLLTSISDPRAERSLRRIPADFWIVR